jgi:hypothetical protein
MVGRIETEGMTLVDLKETMEVLGKSRATVFRLLKKSDLIQVPVAGTRTVYITLESIERYQKRSPQEALKVLEPDSARAERQEHLKKRFPQVFK